MPQTNKPMICPKCGETMAKAGKVRQGKVLKQRYRCAKLSGCGHVKDMPIEQ